jgi:hypothetical protein
MKSAPKTFKIREKVSFKCRGTFDWPFSIKLQMCKVIVESMLGKWIDWIVVDDVVVDDVVVDVVVVVVDVFKICDKAGKILDKIVFGLSNRIVSEEK